MIYSKTCEYAIRALLYLSNQKKGGYVLTRQVSRETGISPTYLAKIFQELVRYRILDSRRGARGGVALAQSPESISLSTIMEIIDDPEHLKSCVMGLDQCSDTNACPLHVVWKAAKNKVLNEMKACNLASIKKKFGDGHYRDLKRGRLNLGLYLSGAGAA